jgi:hypothetical protein
LTATSFRTYDDKTKFVHDKGSFKFFNYREARHALGSLKRLSPFFLEAAGSSIF